jgi:hypothetical protein
MLRCLVSERFLAASAWLDLLLARTLALSFSTWTVPVPWRRSLHLADRLRFHGGGFALFRHR